MNKFNRYFLVFILTTLCSGFISAQIVNIPDANFKAALLAHNPVIDTNGDGEIQVSEAEAFAGSMSVNGKNIVDLTGVEAFVAVISLSCNSNQLTALDLSANMALKYLSCNSNQLTTLDLPANTSLTKLYCSSNQLTSLDISANTALTHLNCGENLLTSLDLLAHTALFTLVCSSNQISSLDLSTHSYNDYIDCSNNELTSLNLKNVVSLYCQNNKLTSLNLSKAVDNHILYCMDNNLTWLDIRNGNNTNFYGFSSLNNPNLHCVSVDNPVFSTSNWANKDPQTKFSSNCACGVFSINLDSIQHIACVDSGYVRASVTGGDGPFQYAWLNAALSSDSILIADTAGIYTLKVTDNNLCESSRTIMIKEPKVKSGFELNSNLHVGIFRPGRLTTVDLSALNDGCNVQNAELRLVYSGPLDFESANVLPTSQSGDTLTWDLGSMDYSLDDFLAHLKFQVDTLAQAGDRVCFEVLITPEIGDFDPTNNLKQYCFDVVNSYDPNDKQVYPQGVCAENYTLKDQPLTYTIRFQNTGNGPAIDVYLMDSLSPYLDLSTMRVLSSSHQPMVTEVLDSRVIKFDFKNINLADSLSDEAGSKGFVIYEISPYSGLPDGTVIENTAGIYFDFNPPVITNTTMNTLVDVLPVIQEHTIEATFETSYVYNGHTYTEPGVYKYYFYAADGCDSVVVLTLDQIGSVGESFMEGLKLFPNPTNGNVELNFGKLFAEVTVNITDAQGRIIQRYAVSNQEKLSIDLSGVKVGVYFVQVETSSSKSPVLRLMKY